MDAGETFASEQGQGFLREASDERAAAWTKGIWSTEKEVGIQQPHRMTFF